MRESSLATSYSIIDNRSPVGGQGLPSTRIQGSVQVVRLIRDRENAHTAVATYPELFRVLCVVCFVHMQMTKGFLGTRKPRQELNKYFEWHYIPTAIY